MEEYIQPVDVEPVTIQDRIWCFILTRLKYWPMALVVSALALSFRWQLGEVAGVLVFLIGSIVAIITIFPRTHEVYAWRALESYHVGDLIGALMNFHQALAVAPTYGQSDVSGIRYVTRRMLPFYMSVFRSLGTLYRRLNRLAEAEAVLRAALELKPNDPLLWVRLGKVLLCQDRRSDARSAFNQALAAESDATPILDLIHWAIFRVKSIVGHLLGIDFSEDKYIERYAIYAAIGNAYLSMAHHQEAVTFYERATTLQPWLPVPWLGLGHAQYELGQYDKAITAYQGALKTRRLSSASQTTVRQRLGMMLLYQDRLSEAEDIFKQIIDLDQRTAYVGHMGLARVYAEQRRFELALEQGQRALLLEPSSPRPHIALGVVYAAWEHNEETIAQFDLAMDLEPRLGWAWLERARLETLRGDTEAALEYLAQALERGPRQAIRRRALEEKKLRPLHDHPRFWELVGATEEPVR